MAPSSPAEQTSVRAFGVLLACTLFASCGGGGGGGSPPPPPPPPMYTVGGTVNGLFGTGLVLENNGGNPLTVNANGAFTITTCAASGAAYNVAVRTQPTSTPSQTCTVSSGAGTVGNSAVTGIGVSCRAQTGRFVYVAVAGATPAQNSVAAFTIDVNTGALTPMAGSPFATTGQAPRVLITDLTGKFLYVYGDDNISAPGGTTLTGFTVNAQTGALTPIQGMIQNLPAATGPAARHPNGSFLYLPVSDSVVSTNNRLHGFQIDPLTGALSVIQDFPWAVIGPGEIHNSVVVSPNGTSLYLATSTPANPGPPTGKIIRLALNDQTGAAFLTGSSISDPGNSFNGIFMHPAGTHFYTRNSTSLAYASRFTLDATMGTIGARLDISTTFGFGLVIAPAGRVYFAGFGGSFGAPLPGNIAGFVDSASGPMVALPSSPYATGGTNSISQALDPTARFLALTNLGSANVTLMRIDPAQGTLSQIPGSPYAPAVGTAPGSVTFEPSARFAYLTDGAGSISSYAINVDTGVPTFVTSQPILGSPAVVPVTILGLQ